MPVFVNQALNSGDDLAGVIEAIGDGVYEFKPGDRVAAMHQIGTGHGSFAEYAITPVSTTFHIPPHISFEEASLYRMTPAKTCEYYSFLMLILRQRQFQ